VFPRRGCRFRQRRLRLRARRRRLCQAHSPRPAAELLQPQWFAGAHLIGDDLLVVPVRFAHLDGDATSVAYLFRFSAGRIVSLTEYDSIEDAVRDARLSR